MSYEFGILYITNKIIYGKTDKGVTKYLFKSLWNDKIILKCAYKTEKLCNIYCYVRIDIINDSLIQVGTGTIIKVIGYIGIKEDEINARLYYNNLYKPNNFKNITKQDIKQDDINQEGRYIIDSIYTVDSETTIDIDDGFNFNIIDDIYYINIHIADLYVKRDIPLNILERYSSIYINDNVLNMYDNNKVNDYSLNSSNAKNCLSLLMSLNIKGDILSYEFKKTVVKNSIAISYNNFDKYFDTNIIKQLYNICGIVINKKDDYSSYKFIEYLMLIYNIYFVKYISNYSDYIILKYENFGNLDESLKKYIDRKKYKKTDYHILRTELIKTNPCNYIHKDIKAYYTHATSPIRRYIDYINQLLFYNSYNISDINKINDIINDINNYDKRLKKFYKELNLINLLYSLNDTENTEGYVINIIKNDIYIKIKLYIPIYDIQYNIYIDCKKIVKFMSVENNLDKISFNDFEIYKYKKYNISIFKDIQNNIFVKKLIIRIDDLFNYINNYEKYNELIIDNC